MAPNRKSRSKEEWDSLINDVVLPRVLPEQKSRYFNKLKLDLMLQMVANIENSSEWIPSKTVDLFKSLKKVQKSCTPSIIADEINALQPGDTFAMFVHRQNCAIMVHMPEDQTHQAEGIQKVIVATFPGNLLSGEIYKHESDAEVIQNLSKYDF